MAANTLDRGRLRRLADVRPERGRVLSVFMNLDPAQFGTAPARATAITSIVNDAARRVQECEGLEHDEREWLRADVERVREALQAGDIAADGARAVAVYACAPEDLLEVVTLRMPVPSRVVVERTPFVEPLVAQGDGERWVVVLANRRSARIFQGSGRDVEETDRIEDEVHRQHDQGGWSQLNYQRSVEKDVYDHMTHVADVLFGIYKGRGFDRLLIGGPDEILNDVERHLHRYLRERIVGRMHLDVENSGIDDVRSAVAEELERYETQREREALDRLTEGVGRGTRGAGGLADVLAALNEGRVETLLMADGFSSAGLRDTETGMLYAEQGAPGDRRVERVPDVVEPAIEKAIEQSARVLRVSRHDDLGPLGGIGAVLRY